ncbi:MAG TPA: DegV family protein [Nevskia sp.]|nr:DegV family protein [Nevskia sp.]
MRIGLVVDSACDLPQDFCEEHGIIILPVTVHVGNEEFVDRRDPAATLEFYRRHLTNAAHAETAPLSVEQIKDLFLQRLVLDYDFVFCQTVASSRSPIFENATQASLTILSEYKAVRARAKIVGPFALRVIDSQNLFAAQGVLAVETSRMIREGHMPNRIRERLDSLIPALYMYGLPSDLYHLRARANKKGDKSVGWFKYALGSAFDMKPVIRGHRNDTASIATVHHFDKGSQRLCGFVAERIRAGLLAPTLCVTYAGDLAKLENLPGYQDLKAVARQHDVSIYASVASITACINIGEGALAFGFCAPEHEFR